MGCSGSTDTREPTSWGVLDQSQGCPKEGRGPHEEEEEEEKEEDEDEDDGAHGGRVAVEACAPD